MRAVLWLTVGSTGFFGCVGRAGAQTQSTPVAGVPSADVRSALEMPGPTTPASDFADIIDAAAPEGATGSRALLPGTLSPDYRPGGEMGLLDMIRESMFGNQRDSRKGMPLSTFFSEGWLEPWYTNPCSTTGAPRQAWINAYDGVFYRLWFLQFTYTNDFQKNGNAYLGGFNIFTPISQRFQLLFSVPFIQADNGA